MSRSTIYLFAFTLLVFVLPYAPDRHPHIDQADLFTDSGTIPSVATICGDADPHQVQPVYVLTTSDNYTQSAPIIQAIAKQIDGIFVASSAGRRHVRFALQGDCEINVMRLGVSSKAAVDFDALMEEARSAGLDREDRKYLLFVDDPGFECGTARVSRDNTKGDLNQSNHAYLYAAVGRSCWVAKAAAHELIHVLGGSSGRRSP